MQLMAWALLINSQGSNIDGKRQRSVPAKGAKDARRYNTRHLVNMA